VPTPRSMARAFGVEKECNASARAMRWAAPIRELWPTASLYFAAALSHFLGSDHLLDSEEASAASLGGFLEVAIRFLCKETYVSDMRKSIYSQQVVRVRFHGISVRINVDQIMLRAREHDIQDLSLPYPAFLHRHSSRLQLSSTSPMTR